MTDVSADDLFELRSHFGGVQGYVRDAQVNNQVIEQVTAGDQSAVSDASQHIDERLGLAQDQAGAGLALVTKMLGLNQEEQMQITDISKVTGEDPNGEGTEDKIQVTALMGIDEARHAWGELGNAVRAADHGNASVSDPAPAPAPERWKQFVTAQQKAIQKGLTGVPGWHEGSGPADSEAGETGCFLFANNVSMIGGPGDFPGFDLVTLSVAVSQGGNAGIEEGEAKWDKVKTKIPGLASSVWVAVIQHMPAGTLDKDETWALAGYLTVYDFNDVVKAGDPDHVVVRSIDGRS